METRSGGTIDGELLAIDLAGRTVRFRIDSAHDTVRLNFDRIRSVSLQGAVALPLGKSGAPSLEVEREFELTWVDRKQASFKGVTAGHLDRPEGLFLYPITHDGASCKRIFVPRAAWAAFEVKVPTPEQAETPAAPRGLARLDQLLKALDAQEVAPVLRIGQSLMDLGLLTHAQLERALAMQTSDKPLGEVLVDAGVITPGDLQTALAHKMGYPLVDLARFPVDAQAAALLSAATATRLCVLPVARVGQRLIVVTDRPGNASALREMPSLAGHRIAVAIAPADRIQWAIRKQLRADDLWSENVPLK